MDFLICGLQVKKPHHKESILPTLHTPMPGCGPVLHPLSPSLSFRFPLAPNTLWFLVLPADFWRPCDTKNKELWVKIGRTIYTFCLSSKKKEKAMGYIADLRWGKETQMGYHSFPRGKRNYKKKTSLLVKKESFLSLLILLKYALENIFNPAPYFMYL